MSNFCFRIKTPLIKSAQKRDVILSPSLISAVGNQFNAVSSGKFTAPALGSRFFSQNKVRLTGFNAKQNFNFTQRISTPLIRQYSTSVEAPVVDPKAIPESVQNLISKAPKTGYQTDETITSVLKAQGLQGAYDKRQFAYFMASGSRFLGAAGARLVVLKVLYSWGASADVLAVARIEVDLRPIPLGKTITITWRGKPVFIKHRTAEEVAIVKSVPLSELRDPQKDEERCKEPEWAILLAICTHLGCVPVTDAGNYNAFFCPCHGSHYDASGRIRLGPAPLNLEVPKHQFVDGGETLILG